MRQKADVLVPVVLLGVVFLLAHGALTKFWQGLNAWATGQGKAADAFSNAGPFDFVTVGTGGDLAVSSFPSLGNPAYKLYGTIHDNQFTPSDTRIPAFTCGQGGGACVIPQDIINQIQQLVGSKN